MYFRSQSQRGVYLTDVRRIPQRGAEEHGYEDEPMKWCDECSEGISQECSMCRGVIVGAFVRGGASDPPKRCDSGTLRW